MISMTKKGKTSLSRLTFIDLFAGIGAYRIALESFGARCVFSSDWDEDVQNTYEMNYGQRPYGGITEIKSEDVPEHDIMCAGFPCHPFSISGKQLGFEDTRGTLFFDVARIVKKHRPKVILLENVKNFATHDEGRTLDVVYNTLKGLGYDVYYDILNAADYGIPQKRERIYFVCFREDLAITGFAFPKQQKLTKHLCDVLPPDSETSDYVIDRKDVYMKEDVEEKYSNSSVRLGIINKGGQGERIYSPLGTAITLSANGGGVGAKTGLYSVNGRIRRLAPRECARLDGFPDSFKIPENKNIAYKQFGNSIVVDVLQCITREIIDKSAESIISRNTFSA